VTVVSTEQTLHKQRQRVRKQERKQKSLDALLDRVPPPPGGAKSISDLFQLIPNFSTNDFWSKVPKSCNPNMAVLTHIDAAMLSRDLKYQERYKRKLELQIKNGIITVEEKNALLKQHGRESSSKTSIDIIENVSSGSNNDMKVLSVNRGQRKAWQVENFVTLLLHELTPGATVVDFGCGSGNLCLALAAYFVDVKFVLVDKKPYPLQLVLQRAKEAGLKNVEVMHYTFSPDNLQEFGLSFDLGIGLHSCGSFTDMVMEICLLQKADCIVCPCCNGGMTANKNCGYAYPRSLFLRHHMNQDEYLDQLSKSADDLGNYSAKSLIEYDRSLWGKENGYSEIQLWKMNPVECTPKHHILYLKK